MDKQDSGRLREIIARLENWKFASAVRLLADRPEAFDDPIGRVVRDLDALFGNSGWFEGVVGNLVGDVVALVIAELQRRSHGE